MNQNQKLENKIIIDPKVLSIEEGRILFEFFEFLKKRVKKKERFKEIKKEIKFQSWALNSKNKLTRKKIYENI